MVLSIILYLNILRQTIYKSNMTNRPIYSEEIILMLPKKGVTGLSHK